jgi:HK97 family phage major capsid protein
MPIPSLPEKVTYSAVVDGLKEVAQEFWELRSTAPDKRGETYSADLAERKRWIEDADLVAKALARGAAVLPDPGGLLPPNARPDYGPVALQGYADTRSTGQIFTGTENYQKFAQSRQSGIQHYEVTLEDSLFSTDHWRSGRAAGMQRATIDSDAPTGGGVFRPVGQPIAPVPRQMRMFLRDIMNVQNTTLATIPYIREVAPTATEYGASAVAEGTAKPEVVMDWTLDEAPVRKIAAWVPVTSEIIDDAPTLMGYIDGRLAYLLAVREEFEILRGDGTTPHLKGILQYSDVQTQAFDTDRMTSIGKAIGKVEVVDGDADGLAMHPTDFWAMVTSRFANQFDGGGAGPLPYVNASGLSPWGLPTVRSRALTANQAIVASWRLGATLWDRMQTTIRVGNQHSDFFVANKVAVLAEERVALSVHRPDFFVKVTLS